MWLILDTASSEGDIALAYHVLHVHREGKPPVRLGTFFFSVVVSFTCVAKLPCFFCLRLSSGAGICADCVG